MTQQTFNFNQTPLQRITPKAQALYERLLQGPITSGEIRNELKLLEYRRRFTEIRRALPPHKELIKTYYPHRVVEWRIVDRTNNGGAGV